MMKICRLLTICASIFFAPIAANSEIKNPDKFVLATYGTVRTLDPAACYDTSGSQRIWNIYETLTFFDGSRTDKFIPVLATRVPTLENGGISPDGKIYRFQIRKGVKFHEGGELTPTDVAYSFKRHMIVDPDGGPMWMLLEALTGRGSTRDPDGKIIAGIFDSIDKAITVLGDSVVFHLPRPYPPLMGILAYSAFCQKVTPAGNPDIGSGKLDGNGIPPNFLADINVRKAFLHAIDRKTYKEDIFGDPGMFFAY